MGIPPGVPVKAAKSIGPCPSYCRADCPSTQRPAHPPGACPGVPAAWLLAAALRLILTRSAIALSRRLRARAPPKIRFALDSPLEGTGFEPSVPLLRKALLGVANLPIGDGGTKRGGTYRFRSEPAMLAWSGCPQPFPSRRDREYESSSSRAEAATNRSHGVREQDRCGSLMARR
jgi:hypothetical protein